MSARPSDRHLRDAIHAQLTALLDAGGPLGAIPARVRSFFTEGLLVEIAEEYRSATPAATRDGRAVIVTAGPPGAGKSTAIKALTAGHRRIDPDEIKDLLLAALDENGLLDVRFEYALLDGHPVAPGELAGWVHKASTDVANIVRGRCLAEGENFVIEGTLLWEGLDEVYRRELSGAGYEHLTVVDVEVPFRIAVEQARVRWWDGRNDDLPTGGRFVSDAVIEAYYHDGTRRVSKCAARARSLYSVGLDLMLETNLRLLSRTNHGPARTAVITPDGVAPWVIPSLGETAFGAVCTDCGRLLTSPESVARGLGPGCSERD